MSDQSRTGTATDDAKGFVAAVLDISFTAFITTRLVKVLYVLTLVTMVFVYFIIGVSAAANGESGFALAWFILLGPLALLLYTLFYRVFFELVIVIFRIFEYNREQTELLRRMVPGEAPSPGPSAPEPPASQGPPPSWAPPPD